MEEPIVQDSFVKKSEASSNSHISSSPPTPTKRSNDMTAAMEEDCVFSDGSFPVEISILITDPESDSNEEESPSKIGASPPQGATTTETPKTKQEDPTTFPEKRDHKSRSKMTLRKRWKHEIPVHFRYTCDECGQNPIIGERWYCSSCCNDPSMESFDVCGKCYDDQLCACGETLTLSTEAVAVPSLRYSRTSNPLPSSSFASPRLAPNFPILTLPKPTTKKQTSPVQKKDAKLGQSESELKKALKVKAAPRASSKKLSAGEIENSERKSDKKREKRRRMARDEFGWGVQKRDSDEDWKEYMSSSSEEFEILVESKKRSTKSRDLAPKATPKTTKKTTPKRQKLETNVVETNVSKLHGIGFRKPSNDLVWSHWPKSLERPTLSSAAKTSWKSTRLTFVRSKIQDLSPEDFFENIVCNANQGYGGIFRFQKKIFEIVFQNIISSNSYNKKNPGQYSCVTMPHLAFAFLVPGTWWTEIPKRESATATAVKIEKFENPISENEMENEKSVSSFSENQEEQEFVPSSEEGESPYVDEDDDDHSPLWLPTDHPNSQQQEEEENEEDIKPSLLPSLSPPPIPSQSPHGGNISPELGLNVGNEHFLEFGDVDGVGGKRRGRPSKRKQACKEVRQRCLEVLLKDISPPGLTTSKIFQLYQKSKWISKNIFPDFQSLTSTVNSMFKGNTTVLKIRKLPIAGCKGPRFTYCGGGGSGSGGGDHEEISAAASAPAPSGSDSQSQVSGFGLKTSPPPSPAQLRQNPADKTLQPHPPQIVTTTTTTSLSGNSTFPQDNNFSNFPLPLKSSSSSALLSPESLVFANWNISPLISNNPSNNSADFCLFPPPPPPSTDTVFLTLSDSQASGKPPNPNPNSNPAELSGSNPEIVLSSSTNGYCALGVHIDDNPQKSTNRLSSLFADVFELEEDSLSLPLMADQLMPESRSPPQSDPLSLLKRPGSPPSECNVGPKSPLKRARDDDLNSESADPDLTDSFFA